MTSEAFVLRLLLQLALILATSRACVWITRRMGQSDAVGEIAAGLLLGPSVFGNLAPQIQAALFAGATTSAFFALSQIGLALLMFQVGLDFRMPENARSVRKAILAVSAAALIAPFAAGYFSASLFWEELPAPRPDAFAFALFMGIGMSITAIPILGRIFAELRLTGSRLATIAIGAAAIEDGVGWLGLGVVALMAQGQFAWTWIAQRIGLLAICLGAILHLGKAYSERCNARLARDARLNADLAWPILALLLAAAATSAIGVFSVIGAFACGVGLRDARSLAERWQTQVTPFVNAFFLPLFFAFAGLRTDVSLISGSREAAFCALAIAIAFFSKFVSAYLAARWAGEDARTAAALGACMNTRALMELVALNVGLELGAIARPTYATMVIMALASTAVATPLIRRFALARVNASAETGAVAACGARAVS